MKKIALLAAAGVGYVLGTKAGRERYEQLRKTAQRVSHNPRVQEKAHHAAEVAREKAPEVKDAVQTRLTSVASTAAHRVRHGANAMADHSSDGASFGDEPYPEDGPG
jgi:hypothetical protein